MEQVTMDYTAMDFWWKVFITIINLGIGAYLFWERNNNSTRNRIDSLETDVDGRLDKHGERITKLEGGPTHGRIDEAHARITDVARAVSGMAGEMQGMKTVLNLIHDHLLNKKG